MVVLSVTESYLWLGFGKLCPAPDNNDDDDDNDDDDGPGTAWELK